MLISFVIPIYNTSRFILHSYHKLKAEAEKITKDYEIIFRVDGCKDGSEEILKKLAEKDKKVRAFSHNPNRGLGYTLRRLFEDAKGEYIIYVDVDLSFDISQLPTFLEEAKNADIVLASKYVGEERQVPLKRVLASRIYYLINKALFNISVKDVGAGFVLFKRSALKKLNLTSDGFGIHVEYFAKAKKANLKIKELPIKYNHNNEAGSFKLLKHGPRTLKETFKIWKKMRTE